jgi:hypothetical protein
MTKVRRWDDLSDRSRKLILTAAAVEGALKAAALVDLWRRPADQVRGSKPAWATAIVVVNSAGVVPLLYFRRGRRRT